MSAFMLKVRRYQPEAEEDDKRGAYWETFDVDLESTLSVLDGLLQAKAHEDGFEVTGVPTRPKGGRIDARGDHRIAMLGAVAGLASREGVAIEGADTAAISFPGFYDLLESVTRR